METIVSNIAEALSEIGKLNAKGVQASKPMERIRQKTIALNVDMVIEFAKQLKAEIKANSTEE